VTLERFILSGAVRSKVRTPAFRADKRTLRHESSEQVRHSSQPLESGGVPHEPSLAPHRAAELGRSGGQKTRC
jgi:hypothetical protein